MEANGGQAEEGSQSPLPVLRSLGERQLQVQFTLSSMYDTQAMGILALNGALSAAAIAAKDSLGHLWWLSLIGLLASSVPCVIALGRTAEAMGLDFKGWLADREAKAEVIERLVARSLADAIGDNNLNLRDKRRLIAWALGLLGLTIGGAILGVIFF